MNDVVGLIGGTGPQGKGLAMRLAMAGHPVWVGSRDRGRAQEKAAELNDRIGTQGSGGRIIGEENAAVAAESKFLLLTVPFEAAPDTLAGLWSAIREDALFVDVTVPLSFEGGVRVVVPPEGSGSLHLRNILPAHIPFTGAFKTLPAHLLEEIETPLDCDTFVFGDDKEARQSVMSMIERMPGVRPIDVGGLSAAATVEGMTALAIRINRRHKSKVGRFRVLGVE